LSCCSATGSTADVLCRRANCIQQLRIEDSILVGTMPAVIAATILGSQCSSLEVLHIKPESVGMAGTGIAALAALTRLRCLEVRVGLTSSA